MNKPVIEHLVTVTIIHADMSETKTHHSTKKEKKNHLLANKCSISNKANYSASSDIPNKRIRESNNNRARTKRICSSNRSFVCSL